MLVGIFHANNIKSARVDNVAKNVNCQGVFRTSYWIKDVRVTFLTPTVIIQMVCVFIKKINKT